MYAAVLTWSIFVKTVLKTIKIEQYLKESKTLLHFLEFYFPLFFGWASLFSFVFLLIFVCTALFFGSGYFAVDGNLPLESILP